jgi:hypothetical protein
MPMAAVAASLLSPALVGRSDAPWSTEPWTRNSLLFFGLFLIIGIVLGYLLRLAVNQTVGARIGIPDRLAGSVLSAVRRRLYVDLDLSGENLPAGTRLAIGSAIVEVTDQPHTGCSKFAARFGRDALKFVNSPDGRALNLRGINTSIVEAGVVRVGDAIKKLR